MLADHLRRSDVPGLDEAILASEYAKLEGLDEDKVLASIHARRILGALFQDEWYVEAPAFCEERLSELRARRRHGGDTRREQPRGEPPPEHPARKASSFHVISDEISHARVLESRGKVTFAIPAKTGAAHSSKTPPLALTWGISLALLLASGILLFVSLGVSKFTASNLQNQVQALTTLVLRTVILPATLLAFAFGRKGYRFPIFSVACAIAAALVAYYSHTQTTKQKESNKQFASAARVFANDAQHYVEEGGSGKIPTAKSTGDPVNDEILQRVNDFTQVVAPVFADMGKQVSALDAKDVFESSVLTNRASLEIEARKRTESQTIIEKTRTDLTQAIDMFLKNTPSQNLSGEHQKQIQRGLETGIKTNLAPQWETTLSLLENKEKAEFNLLSFMAGAYDEYELKDGKLSFRNATGRQRYDVLVKSEDNATKELEAFRKKILEMQARNLQQLER